MEPKVNTAVCSYTYSNFATPKFYWENHKYKDDVKAQKITIPQVFVSVLQGNELSLLISNCPPTGNIKTPKFVSDSYNEGTYVDILSYSR